MAISRAEGHRWRLVRADERAARPACARPRVRREGDPAEGGRVRRALDASRGRDREGARARADEPAHPGGVRRARPVGFDGMLIGEELSWGCSGIAVSIVANTLGAAPVQIAGYRGAEARMAADADRGAVPLLVRPDRAERGLRRLRHPDDGRAAGRRLRHQRLEDVHHERGPRVVDRRLRLDRQERRPSRAVRVRRPDRPRRASPSRSTSTRWGSGRRTPRRSRSATSRCRPRTGSARRARASRSR